MDNSLGSIEDSYLHRETSIDSRSDSEESSPSTVKSKFSPAAQRIILGGLNVPQSELRNFADTSDSRQIAVTSNVKGILANSIAWTDSLDPKETRGTITLKESLKYKNGDVIVPKDSSIIVEVSDFNQAGFVTLNAVAIMTQDIEGETIQREIPENSLLIRSANNRPIKFQTENLGNSNSNINQLLGSAVKGGVRNLPIPRSVGSALSRTISNSGSRATDNRKFYFVEAQTPVSVYVNTPVSSRK